MTCLNLDTFEYYDNYFLILNRATDDSYVATEENNITNLDYCFGVRYGWELFYKIVTEIEEYKNVKTIIYNNLEYSLILSDAEGHRNHDKTFKKYFEVELI